VGDAMGTLAGRNSDEKWREAEGNSVQERTMRAGTATSSCELVV
jgi:hypothetical protein